MRYPNPNRIAISSNARRLAWTVLIIAFLAQWGPRGIEAAQSDEPTEAEVKAAMIYNFAQFVDWPESEPKASSSSFVIGVFGEDPIEAILENTLKGETFQNRSVQVRRVATPSEAKICEILFIAQSQKRRTPELLEMIRGSSTLTIGDTEDFVSMGGMIAFRKEGNRVRFQINPDAATRAGLKISSKLLRLAIVQNDAVMKGGA